MSFYDQVYSRDNPQTESWGWIQWKGTNCCVDVRCKCGASGHIDAEFFYYYQCAKCGQVYAVGQNIKLIELTEDEARFAEANSNGFHQDPESSEDEQ